MTTVFEGCIEAIRKEYERTNYGCGWRFLYTPAPTIACPNGLMWLGINPGGSEYSVEPSVEEGSAYRVEIEKWGGNGSALQKQVQQFYYMLAASSLGNGSSSINLQDQTFNSNFCPFRSPSWSALPHKKEAIAFSCHLWRQILAVVRPRVLFCMGTKPLPYLRNVLLSLGARSFGQQWLPTGWGSMRFVLEQFNDDGIVTIVVRIPHLSQYKLMSREECKPHLARLIEELGLLAT